MKALALVFILLVIGIFKTVTKIVTALEPDNYESNMIYVPSEKKVSQTPYNAIHLFQRLNKADTVMKHTYQE